MKQQRIERLVSKIMENLMDEPYLGLARDAMEKYFAEYPEDIPNWEDDLKDYELQYHD
tara:strand:+ start:4349 stop:4522 length:174 start_codon:yes stop_codon:yes gene_type:complete